jgi:glycosyltransferase involved in cell wall biosynthesis
LLTVSIITPSYNSRRFINDALLSVQLQEGVDVEHIVQDGGSRDGTTDLVSSYSNVRLDSREDSGQSDALNRALARATGDIIGWLNSDDFYLPGTLRAVCDYFQNNPRVDAFYGDCLMVDENGILIGSRCEHRFDHRILLYYGCFIPSVSFFFRRRLLSPDEKFISDLHYVMDYEFFLRLSRAGWSLGSIPVALGAFRWHSTNKSLDFENRRAERLRVQRQYSEIENEAVLDSVALLYRGKHITRKLLEGAWMRERRWAIQKGRDMRWFAAS